MRGRTASFHRLRTGRPSLGHPSLHRLLLKRRFLDARLFLRDRRFLDDPLLRDRRFLDDPLLRERCFLDRRIRKPNRAPRHISHAGLRAGFKKVQRAHAQGLAASARAAVHARRGEGGRELLIICHPAATHGGRGAEQGRPRPQRPGLPHPAPSLQPVSNGEPALLGRSQPRHPPASSAAQ